MQSTSYLNSFVVLLSLRRTRDSSVTTQGSGERARPGGAFRPLFGPRLQRLITGPIYVEFHSAARIAHAVEWVAEGLVLLSESL